MGISLYSKMFYIILFILLSTLMGLNSLLVGFEELRWIFSSSAQLISALVAFLLAGYVLFINELNQKGERELDLSDITDNLKLMFFGRLKIVFLFSFFSIAFSLISLAFSVSIRSGFIAALHGLTFMFIGITLYLTFNFIIFLIDPSNIKRTAENMMLSGKNKEYSFVEKESDAHVNYFNFMSKYTEIEKVLRSKMKSSELRYISPIRILNYLYQKELIDHCLYLDLTNIIKFRNTIVHTDQKNVSNEAIKILTGAIEELKKIKVDHSSTF